MPELVKCLVLSVLVVMWASLALVEVQRGHRFFAVVAAAMALFMVGVLMEGVVRLCGRY